jgi:hypothetical protein
MIENSRALYVSLIPTTSRSRVASADSEPGVAPALGHFSRRPSGGGPWAGVCVIDNVASILIGVGIGEIKELPDRLVRKIPDKPIKKIPDLDASKAPASALPAEHVNLR